ncbi:MAG: hydroxyethylthiazole kinase [Anaerolineae bacterium]|nr:hydroxyethylthiazole kinase [Anaerolineae bacterium]MDW8101862.1 hydroxyethylthiazole kinase [Anaerolineae bacterium]
MKSLNEQIAEALVRIRQDKPLIHHITNYVVMNDTANVTLHLGALPVMAHAPEEVEEMTSKASALVLNIGTLTISRIEAMLKAGKKASEIGIPIVLDPVGAGATQLRTESALRIIRELKVSIVRGNSGEIGALMGLEAEVRGVESIRGVEDPARASRQAAQLWRAVVAITGKRDFVSDGERVLGVDNGHPLLTTITGSGCMATTAIAAFAAVEKDYLVAAAGGLACFGLAAELAAQRASGPASFKVHLFDELFNLTPEILAEGARIVEL